MTVLWVAQCFNRKVLLCVASISDFGDNWDESHEKAISQVLSTLKFKLSLRTIGEESKVFCLFVRTSRFSRNKCPLLWQQILRTSLSLCFVAVQQCRRKVVLLLRHRVIISRYFPLHSTSDPVTTKQENSLQQFVFNFKAEGNYSEIERNSSNAKDESCRLFTVCSPGIALRLNFQPFSLTEKSPFLVLRLIKLS